MPTIAAYPRGTTTNLTLKSSVANLDPFLGGPVTRIARLADKWKLEVQMRSMTPALAGPIVNALMRGLTEKLTLPIKDALDTSHLSDTGTVAAAVAGGTSLDFANAGGAPLVGQFISLVKNGDRFLHRVEDVSGSTLTVFPALKTTFAIGDTIEFANPKMTGFIEGTSQGYSVGLVSNVGVSFSVSEAR